MGKQGGIKNYCSFIESCKKIVVAVALALGSTNLNAQNIDVHFTDIRDLKGQIVVQVFKDDKGFQDSKPIQTFKFKKSTAVNGKMVGKIQLEPGVYGLALLDDENYDNVMKYNFIGMPTEGFGFSNYYLTGLFKPKFDDFKFQVTNNQQQKVVMRIKYL